MHRSELMNSLAVDERFTPIRKSPDYVNAIPHNNGSAPMYTGRDCGITNRRGFLLNGMTLAGAVAMSPTAAGQATAATAGGVQLAQAVPRTAATKR